MDSGSSRSPSPTPEQREARTQTRLHKLVTLNAYARKYERAFNFTDLASSRLPLYFITLGMGSWVNAVWQEGYIEDMVNEFIAYLTYNDDTEYFDTVVRGQAIHFHVDEVCDSLELPDTGVPIHMPVTDDVRERDLQIVLAERRSEYARGTLHRSTLPPLQRLLSYILHFNINPRGGKSTNEVTNPHLRFMAAFIEGEQIDCAHILRETFFRLARGELKFACYHKLITMICTDHGVQLAADDVESRGEVIDRRKLYILHLIPSIDYEFSFAHDRLEEVEEAPAEEAPAEEEQGIPVDEGEPAHAEHEAFGGGVGHGAAGMPYGDPFDWTAFRDDVVTHVQGGLEDCFRRVIREEVPVIVRDIVRDEVQAESVALRHRLRRDLASGGQGPSSSTGEARQYSRRRRPGPQ